MPELSERELLLNRVHKMAKYMALVDDADGFDDMMEMYYRFKGEDIWSPGDI